MLLETPEESNGKLGVSPPAELSCMSLERATPFVSESVRIQEPLPSDGMLRWVPGPPGCRHHGAYGAGLRLTILLSRLTSQ